MVKRETKIRPYTKQERERKIFAIRFQLIELNMNHILTDDIKKNIDRFITEGTEYYKEVFLPEYSRLLKINLVNDKNQETYIKLEFQKVRITEEGDNNLINKINREHEQEFMQDIYNMKN